MVTLQRSLAAPRRCVREVSAKQYVRHVTTHRTNEIQEASQLRRGPTQRRVVVEPRKVRDAFVLRDPSLVGNRRESQGADDPRPDEGEGPTRMGQDDIDVRAGPHGAREDQVDGSPGGGLRVVDNRLREEAADEPGRDLQARRVQEDEGAVGLQPLPDGPEALVAGQPVPVGGVRADAAAELLLGEEEVDLGAGALDVPPVGEDAEEPEPAGEGGLGGRGQPPEVRV